MIHGCMAVLTYTVFTMERDICTRVKNVKQGEASHQYSNN